MASVPSPPRRSRVSRVARGPLAVAHPQLEPAVERAVFELVPMRSFERAAAELPPGAPVAVTCSPAKTIEATLDLVEQLLDAGHDPTPHVSARMVRSHAHLDELISRLDDLSCRRIFLVGGDIEEPGVFFDAVEFLDAFLALDPAVAHIGFTAYPDGHPLIANGRLHEALHRKQSLVLSSGRTAHVVTQLCFHPDRVRGWLRRERQSGLTVPVHLGVAGVVDRGKLLAMGMRLGVGSSLRYLTKNRSAIGRLMTQRDYQPDQLVRPLAADATQLGVDALHLFTFNQVAATRDWQRRMLGR